MYRLKQPLNSKKKYFGGDIITLEVAIEDARSAESLSMKDKLKGLLGLATEERDAVKKLEISGRATDKDKVDVINLLHEKLEQRYYKLPLNDGRRIDLSVRWEKLEITFKSWKERGLI